MNRDGSCDAMALAYWMALSRSDTEWASRMKELLDEYARNGPTSSATQIVFWVLKKRGQLVRY
jgi:hypothetical protein